MATRTSGSDNPRIVEQPKATRCSVPQSSAEGASTPIVEQERLVTLSRHVRFVDGADGGTILDIAADRFYHLNPTGALILRRLLNDESCQDLIQLLASKTGANPEQIRDDLSPFVADLVARRFISLGESGR